MLEAVVDYVKLFSKRILSLRPSPTFAVVDTAAKRRAEGKEVIAFSVGQPAEPTPEYVRQGLQKMLADDKMWGKASKYSPVGGLPELKEAIANKLQDENGLEYKPDEILVSNGGKQAIANAFAATIDPGDIVLLPEPSWVSYPDIVKFHGGKPVGLRTNDDFKITASSLQKNLRAFPNTQWLVLNSPSNPTGAVYSKEELREIASVILDENKQRAQNGTPPLMVMSDDIYEHMVYDNKYLNKPGDPSAVSYNIVMAEPKMKPYTVIINGVAKAFGMTGYRIGYAAGPEAIIKKMQSYQGMETSGASAISQMASIVALSRDTKQAREAHFAAQREAYRRRRDLVANLINDGSTSMKFTPQPGAFYAMIDVTDMANAAGGIKALTERMINEKGVALVAGDDFYVEPEKQKRKYVRLSYAASEKDIERGITLMKELEQMILPQGHQHPRQRHTR